MAIHAHSTTAPAVQRGLLPAAASHVPGALPPLIDQSALAVPHGEAGADYPAENGLVDPGLDAALPASDRFLKSEEPSNPVSRSDIPTTDRAAPYDEPDVLHGAAARLTQMDEAGLARAPVPTPLPSLSVALSRRRAIFGAVALTAAPVAVLPALARPAPALSASDARLRTIADELTALQTLVDDYQGDDDGFTVLNDRFNPLMVEMENTPASALAGVLHKMRAIEVPGVGNDGQAHNIMCSICDDITRLHATGALHG